MAQPVASPGPSDTRDHPTALADRRWMVLVVVAIAQLMVVLDNTHTCANPTGGRQTPLS